MSTTKPQTKPLIGQSRSNAGLGGILTCTHCGGTARLKQDKDRVFGGYFIGCENQECRVTTPIKNVMKDAQRYRWLRDADLWTDQVRDSLMDGGVGLDDAIDEAMTPNVK